MDRIFAAFPSAEYAVAAKRAAASPQGEVHLPGPLRPASRPPGNRCSSALHDGLGIPRHPRSQSKVPEFRPEAKEGLGERRRPLDIVNISSGKPADISEASFVG